MLEGALRQNEREPVSASTVVRIIELSDKVQTERFRLRRVRKDNKDNEDNEDNGDRDRWLRAG